MDSLKPIRDLWEGEHKNDGLMPFVRLNIATTALGQACMEALRKDWPKLLAIYVGVVLLAAILTFVPL